jgi:hypothetical protein
MGGRLWWFSGPAALIVLCVPLAGLLTLPANRISAAGAEPVKADTLLTSIAAFRARLPARDIDTAIPLGRFSANAPIGINNMKVVLPGLVYRAGGPNREPLSNLMLERMSCIGFASAIYHYGHGPVSIAKCKETGQILQYAKLSPTRSRADETEVLTSIFRQIKGPDHRPVLLQCWSGRHASGYSAALVLRQFCGIGGDAAVSYWDRNSNNGGGLEDPRRADELRHRIACFMPIEAYRISEAERTALCPRVPPGEVHNIRCDPPS